MTRPARPNRPGRLRRWTRGIALLAAVAIPGAGPPEVVRVRIPAAKVSAWFPAGSELQVLAPAEFEGLVRSAGFRDERPRGPRILKAGHSARWESGVLIGRSELEVEPPGGPDAALLVLDPWSPALSPGGLGADLARATGDGRLALKLPAGRARTVTLDWQLRARSGSGGRSFALALPGSEPSGLTLDLPSDLAPEPGPGPTIGPGPDPQPGRSTWRLPAARGRVALRLRDRTEGDPAGSPRLWLEGPTRIDLGPSPANWKAEWTLDESPGAPRQLTVELDPGLDLVDVSGPRVASFRSEPGESASRVSIRLGGEARGPSPLTIRAICHVPAEGSWPIPWARPVDAAWTGGQMTVRLDGTRFLQSCAEGTGRRVAPRSGESPGLPSLVFEPAGGPGPVATLSFRRPRADATVGVRGHLRIDDDVPRIEVALTWSVEKGRLLAYAADLPAGWTPDRVTSGSGESVAWHADELAKGGSRVQFNPPAPEGEARPVTLTLAASARGAGVAGVLDLPRVRPSPGGARVVDEVWVATVDPGVGFRPILGRGLAWIDPPDPARDAGPSPWSGQDLAGSLAWRWLVDDAEARADRVPIREVPRADVRLDASVDRGRLGLDWTLAVDSPSGRPTSIPIHLDEPLDAPIRWRSEGPGGPVVEARPLDEARRTALGLPTGGSAFELELSGPIRGRVRLRAHADRPWSGSGRIPLLTLPGTFRLGGLVAVRVEDTARLRVEPTGLTPLDFADSGRGAPAEGARGRVAMFGYRGAGGRLKIETEPGGLEPTGGVIREADLMTQVHPGDGLRHRLTLRVAADTARDLVLTMPAGSALDRLRRDGQAAPARPEGRSFRVAIPGPAAGRASTTLTLDYRTEPASTGRLDPSALLPASSLPCLGFAWEIVAPEPWALGEVAGGLARSDPRPAWSWASALLGFGPTTPAFPGRRSTRDDRAAVLGDLDRILAERPRDESSLGDWLVTLDSGRWPIVVDRLALLAAGWGPASRVGPGPGATGSVGSIEDALQTMGLAAVPLDGVVLITSRAESPDAGRVPIGAWSAAVRPAPGNGGDEADRFQSASRWRGEPTPLIPSAGESPERSPGPVGWRSWRLVEAGWPEPGASATLVDVRAESTRGWLVASILLALGVWVRARPARTRAIGIGLALAGVTLTIARSWPDPPAAASGALRGLLGVLAFWLGRSFRPGLSGSGPRPAEPPTIRRSANPAVAATALVTLLSIGLASITSKAGPDAGSPILALLPFEGPPDPKGVPDRVVMLLEDAERLRGLARPDRTPVAARAALVAAEHRVSREEAGFAVVESRCEVEVAGEGPCSWALPIGAARDLSATVDGRPVPVAIAADGAVGSVAMAGPGVHSLRVRRSVPLGAVGPVGERFRLPINRAAFARIEVARDARGHWVDVPEAAGRSEVGPGGIAGILGPVEALEVRWFATDRPPAGGPRGPVEARMLWDARPVGDLLRVRLTHADPEGASTIRLALEPGLLVRGFTIPDVVGTRREGTADRPEWVAHVDPPWPRDLPIEIVFWRPHAPGPGDRRIPRVATPDASRFTGMVGFRRPGDWSGRLEGGGGSEPLPDSSFARSWGALPEDGMTLAGSVRFGQAPELSVAIGPVSPRRVVRPRVTVEVEPGRLNASIEATLSDRQGRSFEVEMGIPADFRVVRVEAAGMADWQRAARDRLRIQFDGSEVPDRPIRVQGYLPAPAEQVMVEARNYRAQVPWPRWFDAAVEPGTLDVPASVRFAADPAEGVTPLGAGARGGPGPASRSSYRVDKPGGIGPVQWSSPRSRVNVSVRSDLTIDPGHVTWTAVIDCDVTGGPAESLQWNLPTEWAAGAELEVAGQPRRPEATIRGAVTTWKVSPEPPIWGRSRLVIRSRVTLRPGVAFAFPEVAPLGPPGRGSVGRYDLAIANVSGRAIEVAGSPGLQAIDAARYRSDESPAPPGSIDRAYRVTGDRWTLQVKVGGGGTGGGPGREAARVVGALLRGSIGSGGEVTGLARYDLEPRPGPFLSLRLPERAEVPWASVDGAVAPAIRDGPGRWLVALGDRDARRVDVCWRAPAGPAATAGSPRPVAIPSTDPAEVPTLIRLFAPRSIVVASPAGGPEAISPREWAIEDAERRSLRVVATLSDFDRSSPDRRAEIVRDLVDFELGERALRRASESSTALSESDEGRIRSARQAIADASQVAGLEDLVQDARGRVGLGPPPADPDAERRDDPDEPTRIRRIGRAYPFRSEGRGPGRAAPITWGPRPVAPWWGDRQAWLIASIGLAVALGSARRIARPIGARPRSALVAIGVVALVLLALEPAGIGLLLAVAGLGRAVE